MVRLHYLSPFGSIMGSMEQFSGSLDGKLLVTGRHGDNFWSLKRQRALSRFQDVTARGMIGQNNLEFPLRSGFLDFHLPFIGAIHAPQLGKIAISKAMLPWDISGDYNRPIARRIVKSAGVPRDAFCIKKRVATTMRMDLGYIRMR